VKIDKVYSLLSGVLPSISVVKQKQRIRRELIRKCLLSENDHLHIFIAVKQVNWEQYGLVDSWRSLARVTWYDWGNRFDQYAPHWHDTGKSAFNDDLLHTVMECHSRDRIDLFFSYLSGRWVYSHTIDTIRQAGICTVNYAFDDSQSFWGRYERSGWSGNALLSRHYDFSIIAQHPYNEKKYRLIGAAALFLPSAGNPSAFYIKKVQQKRKFLISLVGQKTPERDQLIDYLRSNNIPVHVAGKGWDTGEITHEEMITIFRNSLLVLGSGIHGTSRGISLKGRDFEIPLTGTAYITTDNPVLRNYFVPSQEIVFYKTKEELLDTIRYYRENQDEAIAIGKAGQKRALSEHTWEHRWREVLTLIKK